MPETRRSLRASGPASGASGPSARGGSSTPSQTAKSLRSIRAEGNARKKERDEREQRELAALKERKKLEKEVREADEQAAVTLSTSNSQESEAMAPAIPADEVNAELVLPHDADGNTVLPTRIPTDSVDDMMDTNFLSDKGNGAAHSSGQSSSDSDSDDEETGPALEQMEFIVPLPLAANARDHYRKTVKLNEKLVETFTGRKWSQEAALLQEAEYFVQTMRDIATHVDLANETTSSQADVEPHMVAEWDRSISTKFRFLHNLFDALRGHSVHIIIMSRPGKLLDILQTFLKGNYINYVRTDTQEKADLQDVKGPLFVTLTPSIGEDPPAEGRGANLVLTLDQVIDVKDQRLRAFRQHPTHTDQLAPLVSLAVVNSVDHIERSLTQTLTGTQRLRVLVRCIAKLRKDAGKIISDNPSIEASAMEVARFVTMRGTEAQWPLPPIGALDNNDAWDLSQGLVTMKSAASSDSGKSAKAKAALVSAQKRRMDHIQDEAESSKKMRLTPQVENDVSTTRVSDSLGAQSSQAYLTSTSSDEMTALRDLLRATEDRLQATIKAKDARLDEFDNALSELQLRFEDQTAEKRTLARELTEVRMAFSKVYDQNDSRGNTIDRLKEENREIKEQIIEARAALESSAIPEISELEKLRKEKEQAEQAQKKAEKEAASQSTLTAYLRQEYSDASRRAVEISQENEVQKLKIGALEKTASGEISKVRQMNMDEQHKRVLAENKRLRQDVRNLGFTLQRKEDDLRTRKSGIATRAGSVPRSPRVGPSSRAGSPIPDRRIGALKSNMNL